MSSYQIEKDERINATITTISSLLTQVNGALNVHNEKRGGLDRTIDYEDSLILELFQSVEKMKASLSSLNGETSAKRKEAAEKKVQKKKEAVERKAQEDKELEARIVAFKALPVPPPAPCCRCGDETSDRCKRCKRPVCWDCSGSNREPGVYCLSYTYDGCHP